jgi:hypothetical protein
VGYTEKNAYAYTEYLEAISRAIPGLEREYDEIVVPARDTNPDNPQGMRARRCVSTST